MMLIKSKIPQFSDQFEGFSIVTDHNSRQSQPAMTRLIYVMRTRRDRAWTVHCRNIFSTREKKKKATSDGSGLALYCSHILRAALLNESEDIMPRS